MTLIARFTGPVSWAPGPGAAGITLSGMIREPQPLPAQLSLIGTTGLLLPANLADVTAEVSAADILLRCGSREWRVACRSWQLHRDVGGTFYAAVPPRPTPWSRRFAWRMLLGVAATTAGRWWLSRRAAKKSNHA